MTAGKHPLPYCCFSQNDSRPCEAEPPITQGMPTAIAPSGCRRNAAERDRADADLAPEIEIAA
jgi:hypothetical protein